MSLRFNHVVFFVGLVAVTGLGTVALAAWTISEPVALSDHDDTATIACNGGGVENETAVRKLMRGTDTVTSISIMVGPGLTWIADLVPPVTTNKWSPSGVHTVELWKDGVFIPGESHIININEPGPA